MSSSEGKSADFPVEPLTRREREILALLAEGLTSPEIAEKLTLATSSVKSHMQHLYGKLGVNNKRQAVSRARELGLLGTAPPVATPKAQTPEPGPHSPVHNLPVQVTRFFGREDEIGQLKERLAEYRLVTLTGSGGVGKTRLSLRVAEEALTDFPKGVWFVELAPLFDPALVAQQVASRLGLRDDPGQPILETLTFFLRQRKVLLLLDNCEHVLEACARLADALLRTCPRLSILASSREPIGIGGEAVFRVASLPFPDPGHMPVLERLDEYTALSLFVDRARALVADYQITHQNASHLARICQRLDGIPLAIEMAAARVNLLSAEQLADRLDDAFRLLTSGSRTALPRHQTLRATIDWSYDLLADEERLLLQRLSVFAGGCTLQAAEVVCADPSRGESLDAGQVLDRLAGLVDKSMVIAGRRQGEETRYHLLEIVRQYARQKLEETGDSARVHACHRDYFLSFAETYVPKLQTREQSIWIRKLQAERENLRQALEWSFSDLSEVEAGPRLLIATSFSGLWPSYQETLDWRMRGLTLCQSRADISARLHVKLLERASALTALNDPPTALAWSNQAVEISRGLGSEGKETLMWSLFHLARVFFADVGEPDQAVAPLAEAEAIMQALGSGHYAPEDGLRVKADFAGQRAEIANRQGRYLDAKQHAGESIRLSGESGDRWSAARAHTSMGAAYLHLGAHQEAREHFLAALNMIHEFQPGWGEGEAYNLRWLAKVDLRQGNLERALEYSQESMMQADRIPDRNIIASNLGLMAAVGAKQGQPIRAARLAGASAAMWARQKRKPWEDSSLDTLLPDWREGPEQAAILQAFEEGQAMNAEQAVAYALNDIAV